MTANSKAAYSSPLNGLARCDRRTKALIKRLRPGDIAVIDHADLDGLAAHALADAHVGAVINAQPFISGKYPNRGPSVLAAAQIPHVSAFGSVLFRPNPRRGAGSPLTARGCPKTALFLRR